jgi:hypothetical protein
MNVPISIVIAATILAATILAVGRYELRPFVGQPIAWKLDRWSGDVSFCMLDRGCK